MRRPIGALALLLAAALAAPAAAEISRRAASDFHRRALMEGAITPGGAYAVPLSREAIAALKQGGELRVFDAEGREIPSLVHTAVKHAEIVERAVSVFNQAWREDGTQRVSVELTERKPEAVNDFVFDIADEDYNARVRVEGSDDGADWQILRDGLHLIRHTVKKERIAYVHNALRVPTARFRFYRFTLEPHFPPGEEVKPLSIEGIAVREVQGRGAALSVPVKLEPLDDPRDDDARHDLWKLDLGRRDLGVDRVRLSIPARGYARSASLWEWSEERGRRTRRLASTVLFHYGDDSHTEISGFTTDAGILVLLIDQGDDEPISVAGARASRPRQQLRFLAPRPVAPPLALLFDPDTPREPEYDLPRTLREREITSFTELALGPLEENPAYAKPPEPRSEQIPYLLYGLVVALVLGLGWYVARTIQQGVPPETP